MGGFTSKPETIKTTELIMMRKQILFTSILENLNVYLLTLRSLAFIATITVLTDIRIAPTAGLSITPLRFKYMSF